MTKPWERKWGQPASGKKPWEQDFSSGVPTGAEDIPATPEAQALPAPESPTADTKPKPNNSLIAPLAQGVTFGFADEIRAGLRGGWSSLWKGTNFKEEYTKEKEIADAMLNEARKDHPIASTVAEIGGSILPVIATGGLGTTAATTAGGRLLAAGAGGAASGGVYGFGTGDGLEDRTQKAAVGASTGALLGTGIAAIGNRVTSALARRRIPTTAELEATKTAAYRAATTESDVILNPGAIRRLHGELTTELTNLGFSRRLHPKAADMMDEFTRVYGPARRGGQNITPVELQNLMASAREVAADTLPNGQPSRQSVMGTRIVNRLRDYMENTPAADVLTGNSAAMNRAFAEGSRTNARFRRSQQVDRAFFTAENRAAATGTGSNVDNATRQNFRPFLEQQRYTRGQTPAENAAAMDIVHGNRFRNTARRIGRYAPTGTVSGIGIIAGGGGFGAAVGSPLAGAGIAAGLTAAGTVSKRIADRATTNSARRLSEIIRSGGHTAEDLVTAARRNPQTLLGSQVARTDAITDVGARGVAAAEEAMLENFLAAGRRKPLEITVGRPGENARYR